jgi:SAM-dependent methyltransferase
MKMTLPPDANGTVGEGRRGLLRYVDAAYRLATSPAYRSAIRLRLRKPKNLFQVCNHTAADRYPVLFRRARKELGDSPAIRLLSFGCSTGEEVFSLRAYFPLAAIKGIDINPHNISVCERRLAERPDPAISFEAADSVDCEPLASYDAVFCMAVFRHGNLADRRYRRCDRIIRFDDFRRVVEDLAARLKPGGLFVIIHSNFRFRDTPTASGFELVHRMNLAQPGRQATPIFDRDNRRTAEVNYGEVMFRKKPQEKPRPGR